MAFQDINVSNTIKITDLAVGESITGYAVRIEPSSTYAGQENLVLEDVETGEQRLLFSAGNLKYMLKDGKVRTGLLTRITRLENKQIKGKTATNVKVEQDASDILPGYTTASASVNHSDQVASIKERAAQIKNKQVSGS